MLNKFRLNGLVKKQQVLLFAKIAFGLVIVLMVLVVASKGAPKKPTLAKMPDFTGVVDAQFGEADTESALTSQQQELESLKKQMASLREGMKKVKEQNEKQVAALTSQLMKDMARVKMEMEEGQKAPQPPNNLPVIAANEQYPPNAVANDGSYQQSFTASRLKKARSIHSVSFHPHKKRSRREFKNPANYVPSGTFAKAVVLGGVDADASVDGQNKNNGVMLLKIVNPGVLPNGKRSHLAGCLLTASAYGDISSERAYVKLDKISCAFDGAPILDKAVTGWAFFAGKVGIKGQPLMRDGKVVTWAGISGALSGVAQAAQYAQSIQNISPYGGATSMVPAGNIGPFAALGGASKAADQLSQYYIKRAEQYHPVIQVGSGNVVNIVFKDGFYLDDEEEDVLHKTRFRTRAPDDNDPLVPPEVLSQLNQAETRNDAGTEGVSR